MPKLTCKCGTVLDLSSFSGNGEHAFFEMAKWDTVIATVAAFLAKASSTDPAAQEEAISDALAGAIQRFYRCPSCSRLIVFWNSGEPGEFYRREDGGEKG